MAKTRKVVGVLLSDAYHQFFHESMIAVQQELLNNDIDVVTFTTLCKANMAQSYSDAECSVYEVMNFEELDGLILSPVSFRMKRQREILDKIQTEYHKPVVCLESNGGWDFPVAEFGLENGMELLLRHLYDEHGARIIDFVGDSRSSETPFYKAMLRNFMDEMKRLGLPFETDRMHDGGFWYESGETVTKELLANPHGLPDAVICVSTEAAASLVENLEKNGIRVPEDVIVAGYSAKPEEMEQQCSCLSVYRDPTEMSINAVRMLLNAMNGNDNLPMLPQKNCCRLVPGCTCGCTRWSVAPYAHKTVEDLKTEYSRFPSEYNFMSEEVTNVTDIETCLKTVSHYTGYLEDYDEFYLCLNVNCLHERAQSPHLTEKMLMAISNVNGESEISAGKMFSRSLMIPALYRECSHARAFYVAGIHFMERVLGYEVISYGNRPVTFPRYMPQWTRKLAHCLETQRRWYIYDDVTIESQVRDAMTGLYNYKGYLAALKDIYRHLSNSKTKLRVIALDIERFSTINDAYGRDEGNEVLLQMTKILQNTMNDRDICARFGNDEFVIAGFYDTNNDAVGLLSNLNARIQNYNRFNDKSYSVSIAYAKVCEEVTDEDSLAGITADAIADKKNLKEQKKRQGNTQELVDEEERNEVVRILDDNLLTYHFQPIINAKTGDIFAYEALMRSGTEKKISPLTILKHAEAIDRLYDVERHTFYNTMEIFYKNKDSLNNRKLFVNSIPKVMFANRDFARLQSMYKDIMPNVVVEFTEQTEASLDQVETMKTRRKQFGIQLAVDDYGAGYSNISNLLTYSPDFVKIDRALISGVDSDTKKQYFVSNTAEFAHENGFLALAEGVETKEELDMVIRLGVDLIQGYYTAKPQEGFMEELPKEMRDEILGMNMKNIESRQKKTYIVGNEQEVSLMPLVMDGYTELVIPKPDCVVVGNAKFQTDIVIHIPDNTITKVHLRWVRLESYQTRPCIEIGNYCDVTLVIEGNVSLQDAGIRVPESSSLKIEGDGKLYIDVSADQSYAIGGDCNQSVGNICMNVNGDVSIRSDGRECVGIGGGYIRETGIHIERCNNLYLTMTGEKALGIGAVNNKAVVLIENSRIKAEVNSGKGVAIGSLNGETSVSLKKVQFADIASGDTQVAIGNMCSEKVSAKLIGCEIQAIIRAKRCVVIGCKDGEAEVRILESSVIARCEGAVAVGIGSGIKQGRGHFESTMFLLRMAAATGLSFGYEEETMNFLKCDIKSEDEWEKHEKDLV